MEYIGNCMFFDEQERRLADLPPALDVSFANDTLRMVRQANAMKNRQIAAATMSPHNYEKGQRTRLAQDAQKLRCTIGQLMPLVIDQEIKDLENDLERLLGESA